jgi:hypothetical protein
MTGTRNSNNMTTAALAWSILAGMLPLPLARADDLLLEGGSHLSGGVRAITEGGAVLLESTLSPEPVQLTGNNVRKIVFSELARKPGVATCGVTLANGDIVPGDIEAIDGKHLTLVSNIAGRLVIPRRLLYCLQFGVHQGDVIYAGPDDLNGWSREPSTASHWTLSDGILQVRGGGKLSRNFELPQQFIVRFTVDWNTTPNLRFYFASPPGAGEIPVDRYYLQFNAAGLEIKRESSSGRRYTTITTLNRLPQQYPDKHLTIEIRVDRPGRMLQLYLNDEPEGPFRDPLAKAPAANGIGFESMVEEGAEMRLNKIELTDWNRKSERRRSEERGDVTKDVLIGSKSERFSGDFLEAKKGPDGMLYVFKSAFQNDALEVPESEVATVFFASKKDAVVDAGTNPFVLQLRNGGALHVSSCAFAAEQVEASHPLLGRLTLRRDGIAAMERVMPPTKDAKTP